MLDLINEPRAVGEVFNIGNGAEISIRELAEKVKALAKSQSAIRFVPYHEVFDDTFEDMARRVPDIGKIHRLIGYMPRVHLEEILERVIQYWAEQPAVIAPGPVSTRSGEHVSQSVARQMESVLAVTA